MEQDGGRLVLVVDDSEANLALLEAQLGRAGYKVMTADSGTSGLEMAIVHHPEVILLDIMMPGMDGYEVLRRLRSHEVTRSIPVIILTALQEQADKLRALDLGANDFLTKPVDRAELLARVRTLVEFNQLIRAQGELIRMKDELLSVVSHELRTPLASVVGFAELLLTRDYEPPKQREFLTVMYEEGRRLTALITDFLDLQRLESGRQGVHLQPTDLRPLLERALAVAGEDPERPILLELAPDLPEVEADPDRLLQVVGNLLSNARKYSPDGGAIHLRVLFGERGARLEVQDQGLGLPREAMPRLFQKFYRVDNSDRRSISGTGLGLAICRQIIAEHGGRIGADSLGPGQGSLFWFTLPLAKPTPTRGDVLIVEDDVGFYRLLEAELAALGLSAVRAPNARLAMARVQEARPRAIALDLLLPEMSGEEFLGWFHERGDPCPVVVVTVKDLGPEQKEHMRRLGAVATFAKGSQVASQAAQVLGEVIAKMQAETMGAFRSGKPTTERG